MAQRLQDGGGGADNTRRRRRHRGRPRGGKGNERERETARRDLIRSRAILQRRRNIPSFKAASAAAICRASLRERQAMATEHTVGFEPADGLAKDRESVRRRFWIKLKRVVAKLPFAEDLLAPYSSAFHGQPPPPLPPAP